MPYDFSSLDQETLKAEIIRYIKEDATFQDYNFDGSALNSIANLLTYTTLQQNFYLNMTTQELYLDTVTLFRNAAAIAKSLNYIPYRMTPAKRLTDIQILLNSGNLEIPQHAKFLVDDVPFTTRTTFNVTNEELESIELWQMEIVEETYTYASEPFALLNGTSVADDYIIVKVDCNVWTEYNSSTTIGSTSEVYFLTFNYDDKLTITFGDNIFGKTPSPGSIIEVVYGVTLGTAGNGLEEIVVDQVITELDMIYTPTVISGTETAPIISYGGTDSETIDSIKINAPKFYETAGRAVTASDYKVFIQRHAPSDVDLVNVWNGADAVVPQYGTVFATVKPKSSLFLNSSQKEALLDYLDDYTLMSIRTELVDATYVYVELTSTVVYYKSYGLSTTALRSTIEENVTNFFSADLTSFNTKLKFSNLVYAIDIPNEVSNNITTIRYYLNFDRAPTGQYNFNVQNAIVPGSIQNTFIYDDSAGIIKLVAGDVAIGTVNYSTGNIQFLTPDANPMDWTGNKLYFKSVSPDFEFKESNLPYYDGITITFEGI
jgi:hypothetical protein